MIEPALQVVFELGVHLKDRVRLEEVQDEHAIDLGPRQHVGLVPFELLADDRLHGDLRSADHAFH
jgi:hypothetical protein